MFSPNLASLGSMVQEILDKIGESIKLVALYFKGGGLQLYFFFFLLLG